MSQTERKTRTNTLKRETRDVLNAKNTKDGLEKFTEGPYFVDYMNICAFLGAFDEYGRERAITKSKSRTI